MTTIDWTTPAVSLRFLADVDSAGEDGPLRLVDVVAGAGPGPGDPAAYARVQQPLVEVMGPQLGSDPSSHSSRMTGSQLGGGLRYVRHEARTEGPAAVLEIEQMEPVTGLRAFSRFVVLPGMAAVRTTTTLSGTAGRPPVLVWAVSSLATGAVVSDDLAGTTVWRAECSWTAENRWSAHPLRSAGLVTTRSGARGPTAGSAVRAVATSTWSSGAYVPVGAVVGGAGRTLAWQVEHNGPWVWEVGERRGQGWQPAVISDDAAGPPAGDQADGAYVSVLGPTDMLHSWSVSVSATESFTTVPVSFAVAGSLDEAFGRLTEQRRASRRDHPQNVRLPVVFNDYMDTLEGDPTEAKELPLIDAAEAVGAEYYCIDAGWYDDTAGWWASVGDWEPSTVRFPRGLSFLLDHIRSRGMVPGLWLEPEVVGVTSRTAQTLPERAFLQRGGVRVRERDRYLLDLRNPDARAHLDQTIDRLVFDLGVGYFKLDYNVTPGPGTDLEAASVGHGLLEHCRAVLSWLDGVLDRHPDLVLENCGSGALRSDFAMLSRLQLQSTSDQQDPLLYPAIAVASLVHVLPEQAAHWAYPQATMTDEEIVFTMCTGLAGRLYQAGLLDRMDDDQLALVRAGVDAHKAIRQHLARSVPRFPTGLPTWDDPWVSVAFDDGAETLLLAWRQAHAPAEVVLALPHLPDAEMSVEQVYPPAGVLPAWEVHRTGGGLALGTGEGVAAARMYRVSAT
ncbi:glycoside hydrolase family 36 protein [uncultured Friedmanniella sp.]|uniref:glycoside hydrolase family 36 protein n=1 Tax=uncultured Friedmanniella sp. TaxID=335381 RepID=UPI0035C96E17